MELFQALLYSIVVMVVVVTLLAEAYIFLFMEKAGKMFKRSLLLIGAGLGLSMLEVLLATVFTSMNVSGDILIILSVPGVLAAACIFFGAKVAVDLFRDAEREFEPVQKKKR